MNESELRQLTDKSERDGFKAIFQQYKCYVYTIVWNSIRKVGTAEDAEECVIDVFAEVFARFDSINEGSLKAYIGTVAKRTAFHRFKKLSSTSEVISSDDDFSELSDEFDLEEEHDKNQMYQAMLEKITLLGEPDSTIIIQKYFYNLSSRDIGKNLGLTPVAVRVRLNRALKRMKKLLNDFCNEGDE